jgi:hypothetical protein
LKSILPSGVRETVRLLYLAGKLDLWFVKQDQTGVVFILTSPIPRKQGSYWKGSRWARRSDGIPAHPIGPAQAAWVTAFQIKRLARGLT